MDVRPILSTLSRHKTAAAVIVLEIAITCAIICNVLFLIAQRLENLDQPSGIAEDEVLQIQLSGIDTQVNTDARAREDLAALRGVPGVANATIINQLPFYGSGADTSISMTREQERHTLMAAMYMGGEGVLQTLGLRLLAGRDFLPNDYQDFSEAMNRAGNGELQSPIIVNRDMAQRLFPDDDALGKTIYSANIPLTIVGVVDALAYPYKSGASRSYSLILPLQLDYMEGFYTLRVKDPSAREVVLQSAVAALERVSPGRLILNQRSYEQIRREQFSSDRSMAWLLIIACIALLLVTAVGIIGLVSFWVAQRTRQIGIRRALGASKMDVLRYFLTENFLLATAGIVLGMLLAYTLNQLLMSNYQLPRMPLSYLPAGAVLLWLLGQIAVFWPARSAAGVSPAVATRDA